MGSDKSEFRSGALQVGDNPVSHDSAGSDLQFDRNFIQALVESVPGGISVIDDTGEQVYVNESFCRMFGWDKPELLGKKPPFVYWSEDDIFNISKAFRLILEDKAPKEGFDLVFRNREKGKIFVNVVVSSFKQHSDRTFYLANIIDITGRKEAEEELVKSRVFLMSSLESQLGIIIFSTDRNYDYIYFNNAHAEAMKFAYDADVEPGRNFINYISAEEDRKLLKNNLDLALTGQPTTFIQTFGNTNKAYYECFVNPVSNGQNEIIGTTFLARNITSRIETEQARIESETKFREIIDQINDAITVFDQKGQIIIWNNGAERICGVRREDVLNRDIIDVQLQLTPPPNNKRHIIENNINGILTMEASEKFNHIIDSEIIPLNSDSRRYIQSMVFPVKLNENYLFCSVVRDVTELKRYEKELLRVSQEKDRFYSMIAQYLYTPFNVFNNFSKLMAEELDNLPIKEIQKMARMMSNSASNMYGMLDNLLQWTRMNQGKIAFEPQILKLREACRDSVSVLNPGSELKEFNVNYFIGEEVEAFADKFMLKSIFTNIFSCFIRHSKSICQIDVLASHCNSEIEISVQSETSDLSHENLNEIFSSSYIASGRGAVEEEGITLSMLLCRDFVEKHGGGIWFESQNGTFNEIRFTLPDRK